jgi:sialic acid synthase SpsE
MVFVVAEIGTNWNGNPVILDRMVGILKSIGVNAIKLQALSEDLIARHPELTWYKTASVNENNVQFIDDLISQYDIEWFCTPTYPEAVEFLDPYVSKYKIRHDDNDRTDILNECLKTKKPIYVSVDRPKKELNIYPKVQQVYCVPKYPTTYGELNFDMLKILKGYSNHCLDPLACLKAVKMGAKYLEFHVTDDPYRFSIDNKVSFTYTQVQELMDWISIYE